MKIGIVTVLYNSALVLKDYFDSLENQSYKNFVLYVVDNKSSDESVSVTKELRNKVSFRTVLLPQEENWGVAKGNNIGIKEAIKDKVDYILLSNNDVVLENDAIENILMGMMKENASMAVPKIYFWGSERIISSTGAKFSWLRCSTPNLGALEKDTGQYNESKVLSMASTCFMLINANIFDSVGMMDEKYFVYYDDTDFVYRAVHMFHNRLVYIPNSVIWHRESYSTGGGLSDFSLYYSYRNRIYFIVKHYSILRRYISLFFNHLNYFFSLRWKLNKKQRIILQNGLKDGVKLANT